MRPWIRLLAIGSIALPLAACGRFAPPSPSAEEDCAAPAEATWTGDLRADGGPIEAELGPHEVHRYRLGVEADRFVRLVVDQEGVDLSVALADAAGTVLVRADRLIGDHGPELLLAVTRSAGPHAVVLCGLEPSRGRYRLRVDRLRPPSDSDRQAAEAFLGLAGAAKLSGSVAVARWTELATTWHRLDEPALEADALRQLAWLADVALDRPRAAELYRAAIAAAERAGDRRTEARTRVDLGSTLVNLVDVQPAVDELWNALRIARSEGDGRTEARALQSLGTALRLQGELQRPLDLLEEALARFRPDDRVDRAYRAVTLHELGVLYGRFLGDPDRGRERLEAALASWPESYLRKRAITLGQLGQIAYEGGDLGLARRRYGESLSTLGDGDACLAAVTRARLALVDASDGTAPAPAPGEGMPVAIAVAGQGACQAVRATIDLLAANLAERGGDWPEVKRRFEGSRALFAAHGDSNGEAVSLSGIARAELALGEPATALDASRRALDLLTGVRPTLLREDLRTSFFATVQDLFDLHIGLLVQRGEAAEAWAAAESARAQALRDSLLEARTALLQGAGDDLIGRELALQRQLNALDLKRSDTKDQDLPAMGRRIAAVVDGLEAVRGEIRRRGNADADPFAPAPVVTSELQKELDGDALLLEYRLGGKASYLWAVDRHSITAFTLPPRRQLEGVVREAAACVRSSLHWCERNSPPLCEASGSLLGPVAGILGHRPLIVVGDGELESLAFAALPDPTGQDPCSAMSPLIANHEITYLPSATVLATQRHLLAGRRPAPGWLAVFSDPIYEPTDERLERARSVEAVAPGALLPDPLRRLPHSGAEAAAILALLPAGRTFAATGADAGKATVTSGRLAPYRILHFATHGVLNAGQPWLSSLALSRFDASGKAVEGDLYAHEIHDLDLPAELVVLSACDTARGRQVAGEGLVSGLPRAFLHAGAARVVVSLWAVGDPSTQELMTRFYSGMLAGGLSPPRALQEAQLALLHSGRPPYQWAPFVLQGDPRPLPPFSP